ncbi:hypothetical protein HK096_005803, partial [Nowakowskiella sp. JEL0078]
MSSESSQHQHLAAILPSRGGTLKITHRPTPTPGPNELLIEVKSIALNPIDRYQREYGFPPLNYPKYPVILGSDIAGVVISVGASVSADAPKPGTHVAAFATSFFEQGDLDYGAFQTRVLVRAEHVVPLPQGLGFNEASLLPMAVQTVWSGLYNIGLTRDTKYTAADKNGILIWGAAGSVGSVAVQIAKSMGFIVYATASKKHDDYLKGLGASKVFDYNDKNVVANIVEAAKQDGVKVQIAFLATGQLNLCMQALKALKGEGISKIVSAPFSFNLFWWRLFPWRDLQVQFLVTPTDKEERLELFRFVFGVWLKEKLENGEFVPSPQPRVIGGGLQALQKAFDELKKGVSGVKLVLE